MRMCTNGLLMSALVLHLTLSPFFPSTGNWIKLELCQARCVVAKLSAKSPLAVDLPSVEWHTSKTVLFVNWNSGRENMSESMHTLTVHPYSALFQMCVICSARGVQSVHCAHCYSFFFSCNHSSINWSVKRRRNSPCRGSFTARMYVTHAKSKINLVCC